MEFDARLVAVSLHVFVHRLRTQQGGESKEPAWTPTYIIAMASNLIAMAI